jgi:hypothetical protein
MDDSGTGTGALPRSRTRGHWLAFLALLLVAYLLTAAFHGNWASAFGFLTVPAIVGFFIVRSGKDPRSLAARYAAFVVLLCILAGGDVVRTVDDMGQDMRGGCIERNQAVAQLQREEDKQSFCACFADRMKWPAARMSAAFFVTFREQTPIQDDPVMTATATEAFNQCAALLPPS